jgi:hypothetical protein
MKTCFLFIIKFGLILQKNEFFAEKFYGLIDSCGFGCKEKWRDRQRPAAAASHVISRGQRPKANKRKKNSCSRPANDKNPEKAWLSRLANVFRWWSYHLSMHQ